MTIVITHSDVMNFLRCRRLFKWSVVDDWSLPEPLTGATTLGTRVHAALEEFHRTGIDPVDAHTVLAEQARMAAADQPSWVIDQLEEDLLVGTNCTMAYRNWIQQEQPHAGWEIADIERTVETPLLDGRVILRGKIDLLLRNPAGHYMVEDNKTVAATRIHSALDFVQRSYQHGVYGATLERQDGVLVTKARYIHLRKVKDLSRTKDPVLVSDVPVVRRNFGMTMRYVERIVTEIVALMDADPAVGDDGWYPYPQDSCSWCVYRNPCLLASEGRDAEQQALADKFRHGIRLARYGTSGAAETSNGLYSGS